MTTTPAATQTTTTRTTTTQLAATAVEAYLAAWNAPAAHRIAAAVTPDVRYVDPLVDATGAQAFEQAIAGAQQQFAGMRCTLVGAVDAHHDVCRFQWGLGPDGAEPLVVGFDVAAIGPDGRIENVHGFLDKAVLAQG